MATIQVRNYGERYVMATRWHGNKVSGFTAVDVSEIPF